MPHSYDEDSLAKYRRATVPGAQWSAAADTSTSRTSSEYRSGRGFPGTRATVQDPSGRLDDATLAMVMARLKRGGAVGIKSCGCSLQSPPHSPAH
jgi:hypothetical protein